MALLVVATRHVRGPEPLVEIRACVENADVAHTREAFKGKTHNKKASIDLQIKSKMMIIANIDDLGKTLPSRSRTLALSTTIFSKVLQVLSEAPPESEGKNKMKKRRSRIMRARL